MKRLWVISLVLLMALWGCSSDDSTGSGLELGKTAVLVVTPSPISFGSVVINETQTISVTLTNKATKDDLLLTSVSLQKGGGDITITQPKLTRLVAGQSTTMEVIYTPTDSLADSDVLVIAYNNSGKPMMVDITTLQQSGNLRILPPPSFGPVNGGDSKTINLAVINDGSDNIEVGSIIHALGTSPDFVVSDTYYPTDGQCTGVTGAMPVEFPVVLAPGGTPLCVDATYTPFGGGADEGFIDVFGKYDPNNTMVPLLHERMDGIEVGPEVVLERFDEVTQTWEVEPKLNFGGVPVGQEKTLKFSVTNDGTEPLIVSSVLKGVQESEAFEAVEVLTAIADGTEVAPKGSGNNRLEIEVRFAPQKGYPISYGPLGFIKVVSSDTDENESFITVFGQVAAPKLKLTPAEVVDFGVVGPGATSERTLTFTNTGGGELSVEFVKMGDNPANEFAILDDKGLGDGGVIAAAGFEPLKLTFTHGGGPTGEVWGTLLFKTNDDTAPIQIALKAKRADTVECKVELQPVLLNYGTVPYGFEKTMVMNVVNVGTGPCSWEYATLSDLAFPEFLPGIGGCTPTGNSTNFALGATPPGIKDFLKPGMSFPLEIKYVPEASLFSEIFENDFFEFGGLVQVHLRDFNKNPDGVPVVYPPSASGGGFMECNLKGKSGVANIAAIPGEIDFGKTTVGCHSKTHTVTIYNTGKAPLSLCNIKLDGCGPEFKLKNVPAIAPCANNQGGLELVQGQPVTVDVVYAPQNLGKDGCTLTVESTDLDSPAVIIPLTGSGTFDDEQTDIFTQGAGQEVDVLFVVDNSGSMSDEQKSLANNFDNFVKVAQNWASKYQVGVITTDMEEYNDNKAKLLGDPRFVDGSNVNAFKSNVEVGDNGSGTEQGLVAAQTALSLPLTLNPDPLVDCTNDAAVCQKPMECVPSVDGSGKSYCGGWNMGFLRKEAALEIVFVSDEEDQSPAALNFYIDFFKALKGFANDNMFHAHAIVGDKGSGCDGPGGSAAAGNRYIDVAQSTGGKFHSICDTNWAQKLQDIGESAFGLKVQFFLTRPAIESTLKVTVAGQVCQTGWTYNADSNSVIFDENGSCMPQLNDQIEIYYKVICYPN